MDLGRELYEALKTQLAELDATFEHTSSEGSARAALARYEREVEDG